MDDPDFEEDLHHGWYQLGYRENPDDIPPMYVVFGKHTSDGFRSTAFLFTNFNRFEPAKVLSWYVRTKGDLPHLFNYYVADMKLLDLFERKYSPYIVDCSKNKEFE